jgi:rhodanese-related sulfurtransferase
MEFINYLFIALLLFLIVNRFIPTKGVRNITTTELKNELNEKNKQFVDVRTPGEYKGKHIKGFKNIPLHQLAEKVTDLSKDKEVVVICQSGMRSQKASKQLKKLGFSKVTNVKGGMSAWF